MSYLKRIFDRYSAGNDPFVSVTEDDDNYIITLKGKYTGKSKAIIFSKESDRYTGGSRTWVPTENIEQETVFFEDLPKPKPPAPTPPSPPEPRFQEVTNIYSPVDGYGEVDLEKALEAVLDRDISSQPTEAFEEDARYPNYGIDRMGAPEAWAEGFTGQDIIIAVLDSGVDVNHVDLDDNIWTNDDEIPNNGIDDDGNGFVDDYKGWDFNENDNETDDVDGHGTHVAGIIAAEKNGIGVVGAAYNAKIMPVKVLGDDGSGSYDDVADGIIYAVDNGAHIINMSLGGGTFVPQKLQDAMEYAHNNGVMCVIASGNESLNFPSAPSNFASEHGIAVGAVDKDGFLANFTNLAGGSTDFLGDGNDVPLYVTATGVAVYSTLPNNALGNLSGTSMATPYVAAAVAILMQADPSLTLEQIQVVLANTTK